MSFSFLFFSRKIETKNNKKNRKGKKMTVFFCDWKC